MTDDRVPVLAASDTLLGMLQRGQGAGFLAALSLPPDEVHPHLVGCITCDPRWDCQLDTRSEYYGDLAIAVGLGVEPIEKHLRHHDGDELGGLVIPTLGRMAQWGHAGARDVLLEYVAYGEACADAVGELATWPDAWAGLDAVLCARFPKDEDLITELALHHRYLGEDPWSTWAALDSRLGAILRAVLREEEEGDRRQAEDDSALPACSTLAEAVAEFAALRSADHHGWHGRHWRLLQHIESLAQPSDTGSALEWVRSEHPRLRGAALRALASIGASAAFPDLVALVEEDAAGRLHPKLRRELLRALESLPADVTLPTARLWYDGGSAGHVIHASWLLQKHATRQDLPRLVMGIERAIVGGDWFRVTDALEAMQRIGKPLPWDTIERAFREGAYLYVRLFASRALVEADATRFGQTLAIEALWDCEPQVRKIACRFADLDDARVRPRLEAILVAPLGGELVAGADQGAARLRLGPAQ